MEVIEIHPFDLYLKIENMTTDDLVKAARRGDNLYEINGKVYRQNPAVPPTPEGVAAVA